MSVPQRPYDQSQNYIKHIDSTDSDSSRRRTTPKSPRWSEEAVGGSLESSLQLPPMPTMPATIETLTQENFATWLAEQGGTSIGHAGVDATWRIEDALESTQTIDDWLQKQSSEESLDAPDQILQHGSSSNASVNTSPFTGQDFANSPSSMFAGFPAMRPTMAYGQLGTSVSGSSLLPPPTDLTSTMVGQQPGMVTAALMQPQEQTYERDFLGIGSFTEPGQQQSRVNTRRPLRYKPMLTWFHLWAT